MPDPTSESVLEPPVALTGLARFWAGLRKPANWLQLIRFGVVGGSGFVVNVSVFAFCFKVIGLYYLLSAVAAFCVAVTNNFILNRLWTFRHRRDASHAALQGARFFAVSATALVPSLLLLKLFVGRGMPPVDAQVAAVLIVMPISFLGNKLWSFG